jgi:hypothetical protein
MGPPRDFLLSLSSDLLDGFLEWLFTLTHHEDFSVASESDSGGDWQIGSDMAVGTAWA